MRVFKNGAPAGTAADIDLREGTGITLTVSDESGANGATAVTLTNASLSVKGSTVMGAGDSITAHGYTAVGALPYAQINSQAYLIWASMLSQGRIRFSGVAATAGFTSSSILSTHIPTVVAAKPTVCIVLAGTNDVQGVGTGSNVYDPTAATTLAQWVATMKTIYSTLLTAGILPVACTLPPRAADPAAQVKALAQMNAWITRYAQLNGFPLADFYNHLVDPATGNWLSGLSLDNYHPNGSGAKIMGQVLSDVLCGTSLTTLRPAGPWLPPVLPWLPGNNVDTANLLTNGLMLTDSGAPAGRPAGWTLGSGTPGAEALGTDATTLGQYYSLTGSGTNPLLTSTASAATAVGGDTMYVACRLGLTVESVSGTGYVRFQSADGTTDWFSLVAWDKDIPAGSVLAYEFTNPVGGNARPRLSIQARVASSVLKIGQVAVLNETALGIA